MSFISVVLQRETKSFLASGSRSAYQTLRLPQTCFAKYPQLYQMVFEEGPHIFCGPGTALVALYLHPIDFEIPIRSVGSHGGPHCLLKSAYKQLPEMCPGLGKTILLEQQIRLRHKSFQQRQIHGTDTYSSATDHRLSGPSPSFSSHSWTRKRL
jgi:hypothetical protein